MWEFPWILTEKCGATDFLSGKAPFWFFIPLKSISDFAHISKKGQELIYNLDDNSKPSLIWELLKN